MAIASRPRLMIALSSLELVVDVLVALAQAHVIRRLPEPPGRVFDTMRVIRSRFAYPLGIPDGSLGALNHLANVVLLASRSTPLGRTRAARRLLGASVAGGADGAAFYLYAMTFRVRRLCPYCLFGIAVNFALVPLAVAELSDVTGPSAPRRHDDSDRPRLAPAV